MGMLDARCWMPDVGYWTVGSRILEMLYVPVNRRYTGRHAGRPEAVGQDQVNVWRASTRLSSSQAVPA
ncbi:hypothetical protein D1BOALGB6SA_1224 [Olavius sp. associated proteobacterium Delta 1]|nr:hypothetical protein D1BOALGB6SA_1224 [Olavius sp. associated proteobacterium Delta 1]